MGAEFIMFFGIEIFLFSDSVRVRQQMMLPCQTPHVQYGVAHSSQRGVDAHAFCLGYFFERQVLVEAHLDDFLLIFR